jgi:V8-like Glu-specific endopeptidase
MSSNHESSSQSLDSSEREEFETAIRRAYNESDLKRVLLFEWGVEFSDIVDLKQPYLDIVSDLVAWTEKEGKSWDLFGFLYRRRPKNPFLAGIAQKRMVASEPPPAKPKPADFEALVERSRFISIAKFEREFKLVSRRLCKVVTPVSAGTGFLVAPDAVLTAFHVVEKVSKTPDKTVGVTCLFDYRSDTDNGKRCDASDNWLVESSPAGAGEPTKGNLDFALIRLAEAMGNKGRSKSGRGWFKLSEALAVVNRRDLVLVPQHPKGRPQEVSWGEVTDHDVDKSRVRYDSSTEKGSSGSPCLTADLQLFGLHTQAGAGDNQGVPIRLISAQLRAKGFHQKGFDV